MRRHEAEEHHRAVEAFFQRARQENPELYEEVCEKYPVLTIAQARLIRHREQAGGLIGVQPTGNLPAHVAELYGYEVDSFDDSY